MTIEIGDPEIERIVNDAIRTGQYGSAQEVITEAVSAWYGQRLAALAVHQRKGLSILMPIIWLSFLPAPRSRA